MRNEKVSKDNAEPVQARQAESYHSNSGFAFLVDGLEDEGIERLDAAIEFASQIDKFGLPGLLGVMRASALWGSDTKPEIIDSMQAVAPGLSRRFCSQLLDICTGSNRNTHMLRVCPNGIYSIFDPIN